MTDYASWTFVGVYYGWNIKKILMFNKKKPTPEVLKIAKYCRLLVMMLVLSCSYKVMAIARVGKTIYNSPPCGGASWIKIIEIICIAINYYMIYVQKPTEEAIRKCDATSDQTSMGLGSALKHRFSSTSVSLRKNSMKAEVKEWVSNNKEQWKNDKPDWFVIEKIPDEYLPKEVFEAEGGAN